MSRLSTMKAYVQLPLLLPAILGYVPSDPTEVALPCLSCLVVVVALVSLLVVLVSFLGIFLLALRLICLDLLIATLIFLLKQGHIHQTLEGRPHGYVRHGQTVQWLIQS